MFDFPHMKIEEQRLISEEKSKLYLEFVEIKKLWLDQKFKKY